MRDKPVQLTGEDIWLIFAAVAKKSAPPRLHIVQADPIILLLLIKTDEREGMVGCILKAVASHFSGLRAVYTVLYLEHMCDVYLV